MAHNYEEVIREWYTKLRPDFIRNLTMKYSGFSLYEAENLYQDAFLAIYDNIQAGKVNDKTYWKSYIITIGMNLASKEWRKKSKTDTLDISPDKKTQDYGSLSYKAEQALKDIPVEDDSYEIDNKEALAVLGDELKHTPEPCRKILTLFYYEKISMEDLAEEVGFKNASSVKTKKSQCMKDLISRVQNTCDRKNIEYHRHG